MSIRQIGVARGLLLAATLLALGSNAALARDQWSINHGGNNPPVDPRLMPGGALSGYVPQFSPDFWKTQLSNRIPSGTVLTAILEDDLNSGKNKQGDTFALMLDDGFSLNGKVLIPPKSKIVGSVMVVQSAKMQRNGRPGNMEISLQSLVLPDGSHYPIFAFIDGNPNGNVKRAAKVRHAGQAISDYGESVKGMAMSFVTGPGYMMKKINKGLEFQLDRGDAVPIRLTRSMDINPVRQPGNMIAQPPTGLPSSVAATGQVPGLIDPQGPVQIPGFVPAGANGAPNTVPAFGANYMPPTAPSVTRTMGSADPNSVFNQPITPQNVNDLPDPF